MTKGIYFLMSLGFLSFSTLLYSDEPPKKNYTECDASKKECPKDEASVTMHSVKLNGVDIPYVATAGKYVIKDQQGNPKAAIFYTAYTKDGVRDYRTRPITYCFNGGPGSSSVWLHIGAFGPKRVLLSEKGYGLQPYHLVENEYSLLDATDLVFIDPVSTGYSRPSPGEDAKQFHGVEEDVKSVAEFIRLYTTRNGRWESPKFLAGESYGTTRAAALAGHLHDEHHLFLDGIMLISSVLNFQTMSLTQPGNDLPYILYLPSYTASAWYHNKLPPALQENFAKAIEISENFALNDYSQALILGDRLAPDRKQEIVQKLAYLTGLTPGYIERSNLRVNIYRYVKELLRDQQKTIGRFDSRFEGTDSDASGENCEYDPSLDAVIGIFTATFNNYIRSELGWKTDEEYEILANVNPWNFASVATNRFLNVADTLREVMTRNPNLGVYVGSGYYDLATPYFATDYTFGHLGVDHKLKNHVTMKRYKGGHMMYINQDTLKEIKRDLHQFITENINRNNF
jgi:carboxypeptidase C (cathepsin A)